MSRESPACDQAKSAVLPLPQVRRGILTWLLDRLYGYDVFISYTRGDDPGSQYANALFVELTQRKMRCFLDIHAIDRDEELRRGIAGKLKASRRMVILAGAAAGEHAWVLDEARLALKLKKRVLVVDRGIDWVPSSTTLRQLFPTHLAVPDLGAEAPSGEVVNGIRREVGKWRVNVVRRMAIFTAFACITTLAGVAYGSYLAEAKARRIAREQRDLALDTVKRLIYQVQDRLENLPATRKARHAILKDAATNLQKIAIGLEGSDALETRAQRALQGRLTDVQAELGNYQEALNPALSLVTDGERDLSDGQNSPEEERDLVVNYHRLGGIQYALGQIDAATGTYLKSTAHAKSLVDRFPGSVVYAKDLAHGDSQLGKLHLQQFKLEEAKASFTRLQEWTDRIFHAQPSNQDALVKLAEASYLLGQVAEVRGETRTAGEHFAEALSDARVAVEMDGSPDYPRLMLVNAAESLGSIYLERGDVAHAEEYLNEAHAAAEQLYRDDRESMTILTEYVSILSGLSEVRLSQKRLEEALRLGRAAVDVAQNRGPSNFTSFQHEYVKALAQARMVVLHFKADQPEQARDTGITAIAALRTLMAQEPKDLRLPWMSVKAGVYLAYAQARLNDLTGAEDTLKTQLSAPVVHQWAGRNETVPFELMQAFAHLGEIQMLLRHDPSAALNKAMDLLQSTKSRRLLTPDEAKLEKAVIEMRSEK